MNNKYEQPENCVVKDLKLLTSIPEKNLNRFFKRMILSICEAVIEDKLEGKDITRIDIGIGSLHIKHSDKDVKYRFEPNDILKKDMVSTLEGKQNLLETSLEENLNSKLIEVYKDLC